MRRCGTKFYMESDDAEDGKESAVYDETGIIGSLIDVLRKMRKNRLVK